MARMTSEEAFDVITNLIIGGDINNWQVEALQYILAENARYFKALEDVSHLPVQDALDEDIPDDKEEAYHKGYEDALVDMWAIAHESLKEESES